MTRPTGTKRGKLTEKQIGVLKLLSSGPGSLRGFHWATYAHIRDAGLIEWVSTAADGERVSGFYQITSAGRSALTEAGHD